MTRAEIKALQQSLNQQGFDLVVDGRYGQKTRDAYAAYLDRDPEVPTQVPPAPIPWYLSRSILGILASLIAVIAERMGWTVDANELTTLLVQLLEVGGLAVAFVGTVRRRAPIDSTLVAPGMRVTTRAHKVPADSQANKPTGPFGY